MSDYGATNAIRITSLCEEIKDNVVNHGTEDKIRMLALEILYLNEVTRQLRYQEKRTVTHENYSI